MTIRTLSAKTNVAKANEAATAEKRAQKRDEKRASKRRSKRTRSAAVWKSAGQHLLGRSPEGWLTVTPAYLRAYWLRPEVQPLDTSCAKEIALHAKLLANPLRRVSAAELRALADPDVVENYQAVLAFRDILLDCGSIEAAYLRLIRASDTVMPPLFMDQLVHLIVRNMLASAGDHATDPLLLRAAELLFRAQTVEKAADRVLLTDEETEAMLARAGDVGQSQLLTAAATAPRRVALDVLDDSNKQSYWARSDRFDTVLDFSIGKPALDAFCRVMERWLAHLLCIDARIDPHQKLDDQDWRWHIGLDADATRLLNTLYEGSSPSSDSVSRIVGLFRMELAASTPVLDHVRGRPIYLGLTMTTTKQLKMQPQNLLISLPLSAPS